MSPAIPFAATKGPLRVEPLEDDLIWRVVLATPRGNVLDQAKLAGLRTVFDGAARDPRLRGIVIEGEGPNFSFGASVEEHLPGSFEGMLETFHALLREMVAGGVVTVAAVRGFCLGGALELASLCNRIIAAPDAKLGQPEIRLGVLAPVASVVLRDRIGRGPAEELCLTGRQIDAAEARTIGLVDEIADDPGAAAVRWLKEHVLPHSGTSLRLANRALRQSLSDCLARELALVERLYAVELMATADAKEGLLAFLEKRAPVWSDS